MIPMYRWLTAAVFLLFFVVAVHAQETKKKENVFLHPDKFYAKYFPNIKITYNPSDSTYIKTYPKNYMTVALHVLSPTIYANLEPSGAPQASSDLRTNVKTITGLSFSYRHVTAGFALSLLPPLGDPPGYGSSRYRTATIKYKSPIYILTFRFMKIKGMTDINAFNSLDLAQQTVYRPDIIIKEYEFEGIYNFNWKKYSYLSTIDYTESQIKSHLGFMVKAGVYSQQFYGDSNLLSVPQRPYFESFDNITRMNGFNIKLSPGAGGNLVIKKHFYMACAIFSPLNLYVNRLFTTEGIAHKETSFQWVLDGSASIGYQSKRFYAALRYEIDGRTAALTTFRYTSVYSYIGLDVGYRFKAPTFVKKFYKDTMPPGM
ncbi:hypothetical protein CHU_2074 [Cytophaga hutchinsonii ATCC 33406]|uniref:DUF4421 domain-containing protein n=2 Tax=Cytophaga hutchinsonii TaxID=985 RepID=A0A6N4SSN3_CYTH3|nr:hypothetical protein CHU_2074 [Cytophaga hutchinsonii ATCC 33406]